MQLLTLFILSSITSLWQAFVFKLTFNWFAVPAFDLPEISFVLALGLSIVVSVIRPGAMNAANMHYYNSEMSNGEQFGANVTTTIAVLAESTLMLVFALILRAFI